jgi:hypothetical protein
VTYLSRRDFLWAAPLSLGFGAILSFIQPGSRLIGWLGFSFLFLLSFFLLTLPTRWGNGGGFDTAKNTLTRPPKTLVWMVALAFGLRLIGGVAAYLILPVNGHNDEDDKAGFIYTDAHRRDSQAWDLADSERPLVDAFNEKFAYDQYGGLLAFSALTYRYLSPDAHRPLMLVLLSAFIAALGIPFLWKAANQLWGEKVALASCWIFALYPESILLGGAAMREPYLMTFSAFSLWGFASWLKTHAKSSWIWLGAGIAGMLLVSPGVAVATLVLLAGCIYFRSERGRLSWWIVAVIAIAFVISLFILSSALNRGGVLGGGTPVGVINAFLREAIKWDVYQLERGSGWVQKLFDEMPGWLRLPFVMVYGIFQPVLPAAFVEPTTLTWRIIGILRAVGWYALLPLLVFSFVAAAGSGSRETRSLWMWITFFAWTWVLLAALRGGGDQWDNPRYRTILFLWEAAAAGQAFVWQRESKNRWFSRVILMEVVFLLFFTQWYATRYYHVGAQLPFGQMVMIIIGLWILIALGGWIWDRRVRA